MSELENGKKARTLAEYARLAAQSSQTPDQPTDLTEKLHTAYNRAFNLGFQDEALFFAEGLVQGPGTARAQLLMIIEDDGTDSEVRQAALNAMDKLGLRNNR